MQLVEFSNGMHHQTCVARQANVFHVEESHHRAARCDEAGIDGLEQDPELVRAYRQR